MKKILVLTALLITANIHAQMSCCSMKSATGEFAMFTEDGSFVTTHDEPLRFDFIPQSGSMISFSTADGKNGSAYFIPASGKSDKTLVIFHEWWGLNEYIKTEAENFHNDFPDVNIYAVDLYDDSVAYDRDKASKLMSGLKDERARAIIQGLYTHIGKKAKIATIGWCMGGGWSLQAALMAGKQLKGCVMYYGMPEKDVTKLKTLNADVLMVHARKDKWINDDVVNEFRKNMETAGKKLTVLEYDADHAFANPSNPHYEKDMTADAHAKALEFLKKCFH